MPASYPIFGVDKPRVRTGDDMGIAGNMSGILQGSSTPAPPEGEVQSQEWTPADHTIDEVKSYVEEHPEDAADVLASERAGKDRVTLIEWLEAHQPGT